jgi:hypothetical protein
MSYGHNPFAHPLIGVSGKKQSGKDTFAERLVAEHGFTRISFADPLRELALKADPIVRVDEWEDEWEPRLHGADEVRLSEVVAKDGWDRAKEESSEVRRTLVDLGIGVREVLGRDAWIRRALRDIETVNGPVVITDVRFENEAQMVKQLGGIVVRVDRPSLPIDPKAGPSETELDDWRFDLRVVNDSTIEALHKRADSITRSVALLGYPRAA